MRGRVAPHWRIFVYVMIAHQSAPAWRGAVVSEIDTAFVGGRLGEFLVGVGVGGPIL